MDNPVSSPSTSQDHSTDSQAYKTEASNNTDPSKLASETRAAAAEESDESDGWLEKLQLLFASRFTLAAGDEVIPKVLEETTVDAIVKFIHSGQCKNIITMAGAGISTSAGIPDFRSDAGLYAKLASYPVPSPESIFDIEYFKENPKPFFVLAKEIYPGEFNPTPAHYFIRLLHDKNLLLRHYTQNVDTLEHHAGIPAEKMVEAHGSFRTAHCLECHEKYDEQWMKGEVFADRIPTCKDCSGIVKPDIVFFRESLPSRFFELMTEDFSKCDLLIILGTSLSVQPFASIVDNVPVSCPRLLINREKVGNSSSSSFTFMQSLQDLMGDSGMAGGLQFDSPKNKRDVALIGGCDEGCMTLVEKLGWMDDLTKLLQKEH